MAIKETKEVVRLVCTLVATIKGITADKKVGLADLLHFLNLLPVVRPAIDGIDQVGTELLNLSEAERAELRRLVVDEFEVRQDFADTVVTRLLLVATNLAALLELIQSSRKKKRKLQPTIKP